MYTLTVATQERTIRAPDALSAREALRRWQEEEGTGYLVTCHDGGGPVTKAQLRSVIAQK